MNFFALGFGAGTVPIAPGTAGSLLGLILYWGLGRAPLGLYLASVLALIVLGTLACDQAERALGERDSPKIVVDEVCGILLTLAGLPFEARYAASGFLLFRLFDIVKPYPIRRVERHFAGGVAIMADDLVAALYSNLILHLFQFVPWFSGASSGGAR